MIDAPEDLGSGGGGGGGEDALIEEVAGAYRERLVGELRAHPRWHDLSPAGRDQAFARARVMRQLEAALDPQGLSTTAHAVLARIRAAR